MLPHVEPGKYTSRLLKDIDFGNLITSKNRAEEPTPWEGACLFIFCLREGKMLFVSDYVEKTTGYEASFLTKQNWDFYLSLVCSEDYPQVLKSYFQHQGAPSQKGEQRIFEYTFRIRHSAGALRKVELLAIPASSPHQEGADKIIGLLTPCKQPPSPRSNSIISARENEILDFIGKGYTTKQIAHELFLSTHTVVSHRKNLLQKMEVKNTAELIKKATKEGLIS